MSDYRNAMFAACQSPLEDVLLNRLVHIHGDDVRTQYQCGPYRLDFWVDGIGIEVDGREFHDKAKDWQRDFWIVNHCDVTAIVRFPGAAVKFFLEACQGVLAVSFPDVFGAFANRPDAFGVETCQRYYDYMRESEEWWTVNDLYNGEGYGMVDLWGEQTMCVGSPLAFVEYVDREAMNELSEEYRGLATVRIPVTIHRRATR